MRHGNSVYVENVVAHEAPDRVRPAEVQTLQKLTLVEEFKEPYPSDEGPKDEDMVHKRQKVS